jgi:hypothetical protein
MSVFLWRGRLPPIGPPSNTAGTTHSVRAICLPPSIALQWRMPELTRRRSLDHVWVGSWFLATVFRRDRASFGMRSTPRGRQCRMRRLYPAGLKRPKDEEYRQNNPRPGYQHGNAVQHRDIMTRICAWDKSANAATAVKRPEKITFAEMRSAPASWFVVPTIGAAIRSALMPIAGATKSGYPTSKDSFVLPSVRSPRCRRETRPAI